MTMGDGSSSHHSDDTPTRRHFLGQVGQTAAAATAGGLFARTALAGEAPTEEPQEGRVRTRVLGKTGLKVSEIGFGGHSWAYARVPNGKGGFRKVTVDECVEVLRAGMEMGVNFVDSCTPLVESSRPGEALKRLKARDRFIVSIRVSHKMKGVKADQEEIVKWTEERLRLWQTDCVDLCLLCNT